MLNKKSKIRNSVILEKKQKHRNSKIADRCAPCRLELRQLTYRKQEQHAAALRAQHWADNIAWHAGNYLLN